jgi:hypothetical protein
MTTTADDVWRLLAELTAAQKETEGLQEQSEEANQRRKEADERAKETDRQIREVSKQIDNLGGKWGQFVEMMVAPACETLFLINRGILAYQISQRVKKRLNGQTLEVDVLVTNENHVLIVEVKSSLGVNDIASLNQL